MDLASLTGILVGVTMIFWALAADGGIKTFFDLPSIVITVGGTLAATLVAFPLHRVLGVARVVRKVFTRKKMNPAGLIVQMVRLADQARREGLLALEDGLAEIEDDFLRKGLQLVIDGTDPSLVRNILETELVFMEQRHRHGRTLLENMGAMAPAFGMVGTLIGLVQMLRSLDDPDAIGPGLATALLTTFYGTLMANLFFLPMARKLKVNSEDEILQREMVIEGIVAIQTGDNPRVVGEKLRAFLPPGKQGSKKQAGHVTGEDSGAEAFIPG